MVFKISESAGPYFTTGPARFKILNSSEDITKDMYKTVYLKFELEITDGNGKRGTLKQNIFSNKPKVYNQFLNSINRLELEQESVNANVFNNHAGVCVLGINKNGYSCIENYVPHDERGLDGLLHNESESCMKTEQQLESEATDDDIPF